MDLWDQTGNHYGWAISAAAAAAGYLLRRRGAGRPIRERWNSSWLGRRLNAEKDLIACLAREKTRDDDIRVMAESHARQTALWATERGEMAAYSERIKVQVTELTGLLETLRATQAAGSSTASASPSPSSTRPEPPSSPRSPTPSA
jgi:hypothetical protein